MAVTEKEIKNGTHTPHVLLESYLTSLSNLWSLVAVGAWEIKRVLKLMKILCDVEVDQGHLNLLIGEINDDVVRVQVPMTDLSLVVMQVLNSRYHMGKDFELLVDRESGMRTISDKSSERNTSCSGHDQINWKRCFKDIMDFNYAWVVQFL